jgi:hypothetical protein
MDTDTTESLFRSRTVNPYLPLKFALGCSVLGNSMFP